MEGIFSKVSSIINPYRKLRIELTFQNGNPAGYVEGIFSKVNSTVILYYKLTSEMTFENFYCGGSVKGVQIPNGQHYGHIL